MITPNKFISLDQSILSKLEVVLDHLTSRTSVRELYRDVAHRFDTVDQFLLAVDVLYVLGRVDVDFRNATVSHAD